MKILFLHTRYPAQFMQLTRFLASDANNEVVFLAQHRREDVNISNVRLIPVRSTDIPEDVKGSERALLSNFRTGEAFGAAMLKLAQEGFYPDVVYDHPGWGCGAYAQDIFPHAARVIFCEWFYTKGADYKFLGGGKPQPPAAFAANRQRNLCQLDALKDCDAAITPTFWQFSQYPVEFAHKFRIIHDGIDMDFFSPADSDNKAEAEGSVVQGLDLAGLPEIVTYATRGLEPYRGFPQFFKSLPAILRGKRSDGKTWGEAMREEVPVDRERVHFLNFGSYPDYRKLLRASSVHAYLTVPFVLSWSVLEAMSCGCLVVGSDTPPVREVIRHTENGFLTPFWNYHQLGEMVTHILANRDNYGAIRANARKTIEERYDLRKTFPQQLLTIQEAVLKKRLLFEVNRRTSIGKKLPV